MNMNATYDTILEVEYKKAVSRDTPEIDKLIFLLENGTIKIQECGWIGQRADMTWFQISYFTSDNLDDLIDDYQDRYEDNPYDYDLLDEIEILNSLLYDFKNNVINEPDDLFEFDSKEAVYYLFKVSFNQYVVEEFDLPAVDYYTIHNLRKRVILPDYDDILKTKPKPKLVRKK